MSVMSVVRATIEYVSEGVSRIFSPREDDYPEVGVQPYEGEPLSDRVDSFRR